MAIISTMGGLHILKCDELRCNRKIESGDERILKELAELCGWKKRGDQWICPLCMRTKEAKEKSTKAKKPTRRTKFTL